LLVQFALAAEMPVAWCRVEVSERHASAFLDHVGSAIAAALGGPAVDPSVEGVVQGIEGSRVDRLLLLIDDLHVLEGSEAEQALQRLVDCAPPSLSMLAAPRRPPGLNLSRLKVSGQLLEVTAKHLRFRTWEVERLFRDFYQEPLPPEALADLTRRTEGWAAGLQLFHLATLGKPPDARRRAVASLGSRRLLRNYLADNVLAGLPGTLRDFLFATCVLGRLTGPLCDALLGITGSRAMLEEIELRQIFLHELSGERPLSMLTRDGVTVAVTTAWGGRAPATWNRHVATVRSFLGFCRRRRWLVEDLTVDLERRPEPADRTKAIPLAELERL